MHRHVCICAAVAGSNPLARLHESQGSHLVAVSDPGAPCLHGVPGMCLAYPATDAQLILSIVIGCDGILLLLSSHD